MIWDRSLLGIPCFTFDRFQMMTILIRTKSQCLISGTNFGTVLFPPDLPQGFILTATTMEKKHALVVKNFDLKFCRIISHGFQTWQLQIHCICSAPVFRTMSNGNCHSAHAPSLAMARLGVDMSPPVASGRWRFFETAEGCL